MLGHKEKSKNYHEAATLLNKEKYYTASLHTTYYSFIQFILYVLYERMKYDPTKFQQELKQNHTGTHSYACKLVGIELCKRNMDDYKWYQKTYPEIKKFREEADYSANSVSSSDSLLAATRSTDLVSLLQHNFK